MTPVGTTDRAKKKSPFQVRTCRLDILVAFTLFPALLIVGFILFLRCKIVHEL